MALYESAGNGRLTSRFFRDLIGQLIERMPPIDDPLPPAVRQQLRLPGRWEALRGMHFPDLGTEVGTLNRFATPQQFRLIFEEFFFQQLEVLVRRRKRQQMAGISFKFPEAAFNRTDPLLVPDCTPTQKRVLKEIAADMLAPWPMRRLLQGDVGSGKMMVALLASAIAIESGCQVAVIAPSQILAEQHFLYFREMCQRARYRLALVDSEALAPGKTELKRQIAEGRAQVVVAPEGLIPQLKFQALGLVIIDEQYGVGFLAGLKLPQRKPVPDMLVMTAVPIPRTQALTLYGELDISEINEMSPRRAPVVTRHLHESRRDQAYELMRRQLKEGRQAYVVHPVSEGSEQADLKSAMDLYERLARDVFPCFRVGLLHGGMTTPQIESVISAFKSGRLQLLVTTTLIGVGMNVPNATVMVIEQAERFRLAQLHQLRGRVGRGAEECYCILLTRTPPTDEARERIGVLVRTQDGFEVGEADVTLPPPEALSSFPQPGKPVFRVADLKRDREVLELARRAAGEFLNQATPKQVSQLLSYLRDR